MERATRLFDCMPIQAAAPVGGLLNAKVNGEWKPYSTAEVHKMVNQLSIALLDMGVSAGDGTTESRDKIALISNGRPEWVILDLAVQQIGAILVPLYPNSTAKELEQILNGAEVKYVFVSNGELCGKITELRANISSLHEIYTFDEVPGCLSWTSILCPLQPGDIDRITNESDKVRAEDVTTIIYTSGTTGRPKGVMLTHKNVLTNVRDSSKVLNQIPSPNKSALSFLPLNHIFEKMCTYIYLFNGFSISYAESMETIGPNLREVKPDIFTAVPRLLEKVFERIMAEGQKLTGIKKKIFLWSITVAEEFEISGKSAWYKAKLAIADKLVYSKWRAAVGGNVRAIVVGSSATPIKLEKIFTAANIVILEGYGLTETSPVIAVNHYDPKERKFGTVGPLLGDVQVSIAEDGEILCKGDNVMEGYYKDPEMTAEVMQDGWFHTGDIGTLEDGKFLKITDRKKEIFKTSGGKYVAPLPIENKMKENHFIEQMMVVGPGRKYVAALIVPSYTNLLPWCKEHNITNADHKQLTENERVLALFKKAVAEFNQEFNHVEQVKKICLLPDEWSVEHGELTPTGKMKRKVITEKYGKHIEQLYADGQLPAGCIEVSPAHA